MRSLKDLRKLGLVGRAEGEEVVRVERDCWDSDLKVGHWELAVHPIRHF